MPVPLAAFASSNSCRGGRRAPPCSGKGLSGTERATGSLRGFHLVVDSLAAVWEDGVGRGVEVGAIRNMGSVLSADFRDPDGNTWVFQWLLPWG